MIYLAAISPRFVHIKEDHEDRDDFVERIRTNPVQLKIHPSIPYFAHNWRSRLNLYSRQLTLEVFGIHCPPTRHQPWESTEQVPDISHHLLANTPGMAWEIVRKGSFYSTAPIPALLHVSRESRHALINAGYELAFRTRTCGPHTWFNFKIDVLYLECFPINDWDVGRFHFMLSGNSRWDVGQFEPQDMKRVRKLALQSAATVVAPGNENGVQDVSSVLALFTGVEELFLEEQALNKSRNFPRRRSRRREQERFWTYMPPDEVDILSSTFEREDIVCSTGYRHLALKNYKAENMGHRSQFFTDVARKFEEQLTSRQDELISREWLAPWKIPKVRIVYITYPWTCRKVLRWRWRAWDRFHDEVEENARARAHEEALRSIDVPPRHFFHYDSRPLSPYSEQFQDDEEEYRDRMYMDVWDYYDVSDIEHVESAWILRPGVGIPEPQAR